MGKRKSAKPQKYVQPSEDEDEDNIEFYDEMDEESENIESAAVLKQTNERNNRSLWMKEKPPEIKKETVESEFWATHFPIQPDGVTSNNKFDFNNFKLEESASETSRPSHQSSPLETLLSERIFNSNPYLEERLNKNLSGTESDRRSGHDFDSDRRGSRPKRRRKYVTYPATFRLEVVEHAERFGKSAAAKKYNICVEKVSMWCKTKDNIVHKVKKGGQTSADGSFDLSYDDRMDDLSAAETPERMVEDDAYEVREVEEEKRHQVSQELDMLYNEDSEGSDKCEADNEADLSKKSEIVYPAYFKFRVLNFALDKGEKEASEEFNVCRKRLTVWCQAKDYLMEYVNTNKVEEWEVDLYVTLKKLLEENFRVTVRDLIVRAEQAQLASSSSKSTISTAWLTDWCQKFKVCFKSVINSTPQPLTENTCLILETSIFKVDREELQMQQTCKKMSKVQDLIDCSRTLDASPSASDREDSISSFSFSSKRRRRSYTLAFKLEVVKFAQSHTKHATSRKYGIARRVISRWIADKDVLQTDLMNATKHVLNDNVTEEIDSKLLQYYKELKRKGLQVTKSMLCTRANCLFEQQNGTTATRRGIMSATNGWFRHWVVKWKERGENIEVEDDATPSSSTVPSIENVPVDLQVSKNSEGSSLNALKQAYMTNAILSTMKPTEMDLKIMSQFPELLGVIQQNPSILNAAAALQCEESSHIFKQLCNTSLHTVMNLSTKDNSLDLRSQNHVADTTVPEDKKLAAVKKRRERYSPDFKLMVIDYAASHSYQETSRKFGVHHITVSEWCKDKERIRKKVYCENLQTLHTKILKSETAEQKFLSWIQDCNRQKVIIKPTDVQDKASEILNIIGEAEVKKNCWWFYLWNKRGMDSERPYDDEADMDVLEKESRVNYPPAVKVEIAKVAERQSVNCAARCFRVARKRIREWVKCKDKLKWLAETGQVRERGGSSGGKKVNCIDVDKEVYDWYCTLKTPENTPPLSKIRAKALEIFQNHGFVNMKCSKEWYKNWCRRYGICRSLQKDNQLIKWILCRYDKNLPITNQELVGYAVSEKMKRGVTLNDEPAEEYVYSFCKRYPRLLEALPGIREIFPEEMEAEVAKFRVMIRELQEENNFSLLAIGCMDEIPLLFTVSGSERRVIINSGMSSWNAVAILSCLADGTLLPPMIILKGPDDTPLPKEAPHVLFRERKLVDHHLIKKWVKEVWLNKVPSPSLLLMDCFEPHIFVSVQEMMLEAGITPVLMPEGCASKLQPLNACLTRNFQDLVQEIWSSSGGPFQPPRAVTNTSSTFPNEITRCIMSAYGRLQTKQDLVRRSFAMAGVSDGKEDSAVMADWFGGSGDEHVLSPVGVSDQESDFEA